MKISDFVVGGRVSFSYNGKNRYGVVDKVHANAVCVKIDAYCDGGGFKSFSFDKIRGELDASKMPIGWDRVDTSVKELDVLSDAEYDRRMNIIDNGR